MKLLRLKITDPKGFRSLQPGFEHYFRTEWQLEDELKHPRGLAPFVCAGPNGSGKSNLLEVLAAIFFQLEVLRVRRAFLPDVFTQEYAEVLLEIVEGIPEGAGNPNAFELEYLIPLSEEFWRLSDARFAHVLAVKEPGASPEIHWLNRTENVGGEQESVTGALRDALLPQFVVAYSSGENQILSLPFFKMRFIQFDEYWNALGKQLPYSGRPETRMAYLDAEFSQAIALCNMLFHNEDTLRTLGEVIGIGDLQEFRIILKRSIPVEYQHTRSFYSPSVSVDEAVKRHPALFYNDRSQRSSRDPYANLMFLLESNDESADNFDPIVTKLKRCATIYYADEESDTLYLDYFVNDATRRAFSDNFDFEVNKSPIALFQAFQVLLSLNLYSVNEKLKAELYKSDSHYVSETVPTLASDERIMRFKFVKFTKEGVEEPVMLKSLSDGEHQLLHSLGLCLLFKNTNSLFLLDEPETHFNPEWRSSFISRLRECFADADDTHEMLITTHSPFLISDSKPDRVLEFEKKDGKVHVKPPEYNTFGASVNKITLATFDKRETIGGVAQTELERLKAQFDSEKSPKDLIEEIYRTLGDSVERTLLLKSILDQSEEKP